MIDVEPTEKPNMDKLDNDPEDTNVEIPKPNADPDRSSNSPSKNNKEIAEFNKEKSLTKSEMCHHRAPVIRELRILQTSQGVPSARSKHTSGTDNSSGNGPRGPKWRQKGRLG